MVTRPPVSHARTSGAPRGAAAFTIVEFVTAMTIASIALLGVSTVYRQAMSAATTLETRVDEAHRAEAVAGLVAKMLQRCVNLPRTAALQADVDATGTGTLTCTVAADGKAGGATVRHHRFRWRPQADGTTVIQLQSVGQAGTRSAPGAPTTPAWDNVAPQTIGQGLDVVELNFRPRHRAASPWQRTWAGPVGHVTIRLRIRAGDYTAEHFVTPPAEGVLGTTP